MSVIFQGHTNWKLSALDGNQSVCIFLFLVFFPKLRWKNVEKKKDKIKDARIFSEQTIEKRSLNSPRYIWFDLLLVSSKSNRSKSDTLYKLICRSMLTYSLTLTPPDKFGKFALQSGACFRMWIRKPLAQLVSLLQYFCKNKWRTNEIYSDEYVQWQFPTTSCKSHKYSRIKNRVFE